MLHFSRFHRTQLPDNQTFLYRCHLAEPYKGFSHKTASLPVNNFVICVSRIQLGGYSGDKNVLVARVIHHNRRPFRNPMQVSVRESNEDDIAESIGYHKVNLFRHTLQRTRK